MSLRRDTPEKGPERLGEILSRLFTARGWGRRQDRLHLEKIWNEAVGPDHAAHSRVGAVRRGVLEVVGDNAVLLQELADYHKRRLLERAFVWLRPGGRLVIGVMMLGRRLSPADRAVIPTKVRALARSTTADTPAMVAASSTEAPRTLGKVASRVLGLGGS